MGGALTKPRPIVVSRKKNEIPNFAGAILTKALIKGISRAAKDPWINSFIKLHCYLRKGCEGRGSPLY